MCRAVVACCGISWREYTEEWNFNQGLRAAWLMIFCPPINSYILHNFICGSLNCITIKAICNFLLSLHVMNNNWWRGISYTVFKVGICHLCVTNVTSNTYAQTQSGKNGLLCLTRQTRKIKQFLCSDWLDEWTGWAFLALLVLYFLYHMKKIFEHNFNKYFID